jgi:hypothetical protein
MPMQLQGTDPAEGDTAARQSLFRWAARPRLDPKSILTSTRLWLALPNPVLAPTTFRAQLVTSGSEQGPTPNSAEKSPGSPPQPDHSRSRKHPKSFRCQADPDLAGSRFPGFAHHVVDLLGRSASRLGWTRLGSPGIFGMSKRIALF